MGSSRFTKQNVSEAVVDYEEGKPSQFMLQFPEESKAFFCSYNTKEDPEAGEIGLGLDALWERAQHH